MTNAEKFLLCLERAKQIVSAYRQEAPAGCDPKATWVAVAGFVVQEGVADAKGEGLFINNKKKDAAAASSAAMKSPNLKRVDFPNMPSYIPADFWQLEKQAIQGDRAAYSTSDADFARRHPGVVAAEQGLEKQTREDWQGEHELSPALQAAYMQSGFGSAADAFGDIGPVLKAGSAGEATAAKHLGLDIMGFQDRNRQQRMGSLATAESIMPRRQIGLTGSDAASIGLSNISALNAWNQAEHQENIQELQYNAEIDARNKGTAILQGNAAAAAQAQVQAANAAMWSGAASSALQLGGQVAGSYAGKSTAAPTWGGNTSVTGARGTATYGGKAIPTATAVTARA